jgi:hypothetical protein
MTNEEKDYRSLERQYTDLNALWMAKNREAAALRAELQGLADTGKRVEHAFKEDADPQPMADNQYFALQGLTQALVSAKHLLSKEAH